MITRRFFSTRMAAVCLTATSSRTIQPEALPTQTRATPLYDSFLFKGKPDLSHFGFKSARTVYQAELWPRKSDYGIPHEKTVRAKARAVLAEGRTSEAPVILDVEQYSVDLRLNPSHINTDTSRVDANLLKLKHIIQWFKEAAPPLKIGFFDIAPLGGFPVTGRHPAGKNELATWQKANDYLIPFVTNVDALYPPLYTATTNASEWVDIALRALAEAKRIASGKPVRPFVWPQYHDVMRAPLAGTYIDYAYWMLQLRTIREVGVSGIVFWGGYKTQWDDTKDWWRATLDFIASI